MLYNNRSIAFRSQRLIISGHKYHRGASQKLDNLLAMIKPNGYMFVFCSNEEHLCMVEQPRFSYNRNRYVLFVAEDKSNDDNTALSMVESYIKDISSGIELVVKQNKSKSLTTPFLHAGFDEFSGLDEIRSFIQQEKMFAEP